MSEVDPKLCFIDTNVWLYAFVQIQGQDKADRAKAIIEASKIIVNSQVINEVCVNLVKKARFDEVSTRNPIESFYRKYRVAEISMTFLVKASELRDGYSISY